MKKYRTLSLFSGACGLDLGVERTGRFEIEACVEQHPVFCETIRANRDAGQIGSPSMQVIEADISALDPDELMEQLGIEPGDIDVVLGGPPCQAFSTAGRRQSVADPRGELLWDFLRLIERIQPKFFIMENVRGLLSAALNHRPIAERPNRGGPPLTPSEEPGSVVSLWVDDLHAAAGAQYRVDCFEVNAVNYGAPQLRERVLFIGNREGLAVDFPQPTHGAVARGEQPRLIDDEEKPFKTLRDALEGIDDPNPVLLDFSARKKQYLAMVTPGGNWRTLPVEVQQESMGRAWHAKGGRSGWWRRLSWDLPCPTVVTMPNHASTSMCHPEEVRVLSLRECAAIQEFPNNWEFKGTAAQQYQQVGNAVPIRLGSVAGDAVAEALDSLQVELNHTDVAGLGAALPESELPVFRRIYLRSHIRTRQWYKAGENFVWSDGGDNKAAEYSARK